MMNIFCIFGIFVMFLGSYFIFGGGSWYFIWFGMEVNLLGFLPLLVDKKNKFTSEIMLKYFLIQVFGSSTLLMLSFGVLDSFFVLSNYFMFFCLLLKLGSAPFHFWLPPICSYLNWETLYLLLSWQKLGPLSLVFNFFDLFFVYIVIFLNLVVGSLGGLNQANWKKLLGYSSISHIGWLFSGCLFSKLVTLVYMFFYFIVLFSILFFLSSLNVNKIFSSLYLNYFEKVGLIFSLFSLGGLPPFTGFWPKLILLYFFWSSLSFSLMFFLLISTLVNLFYYFRLAYYLLMSPSLSFVPKLSNLFFVIFLNFFGVLVFLFFI